MQAHYRGAIRSGFVSHADEDDEEVLSRIRSQSLLDADWLVNKVGCWAGAARLSAAAASLAPQAECLMLPPLQRGF